MHKNYMVKVLQTMDDMIYDNHFVARKNSTILREKFKIFQSFVKKAVFCHFGVCRRYEILQKLKKCAIK